MCRESTPPFINNPYGFSIKFVVFLGVKRLLDFDRLGAFVGWRDTGRRCTVFEERYSWVG